MDSQYNTRNPAVRRLMKEAAELSESTELYHAHPIDDNLFEWHFTVRGPPDTDFAAGIYHGRIQLPTDYPMKPPIRTALLAIIGFMPTSGGGAIGSLDYSPAERKALAARSKDWCCNECKVVMRDVLPPLTDASKSAEAEAKELATQISFQDDETRKKRLAEEKMKESSTPRSTESVPSAATVPEPEPMNEVRERVRPAPVVTLNQPIQYNNHNVRGTDGGVSTVYVLAIMLVVFLLAVLLLRRVIVHNQWRFHEVTDGPAAPPQESSGQ